MFTVRLFIAGSGDSHFSGSYLLVALMGGTFDIRWVLTRSLVRLVLFGAGWERGWVGVWCCARCWVLRDRAAFFWLRLGVGWL